jgi:hypothetical protein
MSGMNPAPSTVFWESLKQGMVAWPFETSPGMYFALPIYLVLPVVLILLGAVAAAIAILSRPPRVEN